jgi:hypothetical protein
MAAASGLYHLHAGDGVVAVVVGGAVGAAVMAKGDCRFLFAHKLAFA